MAMPPTPVKPNILYLHSHDTGRYVQPYGLAIPTPNIQRLAEEGILFRQAFSAAPTCCPSRAALLTGQCPHSAGMVGQITRGFALRDYQQHVVHTLRCAGYCSTLIGMQHVARDPRLIGYDQIIDLPSRHVEHVAPAAARFLAAAPAEPFFLAVGFAETHRPYPSPGPAEDPRYTAPPRPLPDDPRIRKDMAAFAASARVFDAGVGQVLAALDASPFRDNTLVICTTDHGIAFPGMKGTLTDGGLGVMLILRGPDNVRGGRTCAALVSQIDLYPTLCQMAGIDTPPWVEGVSMLPLIQGRRGEIRDQVFGETNYHAAYDAQRAVRTKRWKYIRRFDQRCKPVACHVDDSGSKDVWLEHGWSEQHVATEQLYDLVLDPLEQRNLAEDPRHADTLTELRGRLAAWMQETDDPLLTGPVAAPSGVMLNDPDDLSPFAPRHRVP